VSCNAKSLLLQGCWLLAAGVFSTFPDHISPQDRQQEAQLTIRSVTSKSLLDHSVQKPSK